MRKGAAIVADWSSLTTFRSISPVFQSVQDIIRRLLLFLLVPSYLAPDGNHPHKAAPAVTTNGPGHAGRSRPAK